ncbi:MAG: response regulator [candidate division KSB1 bacterium]|nr:response regulator [candidate division KSB1 bacterium]
MLKKKIFIIDDDVTFLKLLKILFEKENYQVITESNATDICQKLKQSRPDIVLLDLLIPNQNGFQIFKQMKHDHFCSTIPVVVLTSHQNINSKIQLLREGVLDYIYKPFRKEELLLKMKNYLQHLSAKKAQPFNEDLLFHQLKEILSARKKEWIEPQLDKKSLYGYVYQDIRLVSDIPIYGKERDLLEDWADRKLLERSLVDIIDLCPLCYHYNISLTYICPLCGSINVEQKKSDDQAPRSFLCNDCGMALKAPQIRCHCINCDEKFGPEKIVKQKIYRYQFAQNGAVPSSSEPKIVSQPKVITEPLPKTSISRPSIGTGHLYIGSNQVIQQVLKETNVRYVQPNSFLERVTKEIRFSKIEYSDMTIMAIGVQNLNQLTQRMKQEMVFKIFKGILYIIIQHLRSQDILSYNDAQLRYLVMLPNTHIKLAKIIAEKIHQRLDRFRSSFQLDIRLASYPQDGLTVDELFAMLEIGLEKVTTPALI